MADNVNVTTDVTVKKRISVSVETKLANTGTSSVDLSGLQKQINELSSEMDNKVDKVEGKDLSSNDFTDDLKSKLEGLENYNDAELCEKINKLETNKVDKVEGYGLSKNDLTDELLSKLQSLENYDDSEVQEKIKSIETILSSDDIDLDTLQELVNALKNNISDISDIFNELSKKVDKVDGYGLSKNDLTDELLAKLQLLENYDDTEIQNKITQIEFVLTSDDTDLDTLQELVNALKNNVASIGDIFTELAKKANSSDIPTKVSQLENDSGYLTEHQDISGKADKKDVYTKEETDTKIEELKQNISSYSQSFTGTVEEYKLAEENGLITNGMILFIIDDDETTLEDDGSTSSILGKGKLGYMLLA